MHWPAAPLSAAGTCTAPGFPLNQNLHMLERAWPHLLQRAVLQRQALRLGRLLVQLQQQLVARGAQARYLPAPRAPRPVSTCPLVQWLSISSMLVQVHRPSCQHVTQAQPKTHAGSEAAQGYQCCMR